MYKFSQQLKKRLIAYFLQKHQVDLSQEQAEQYLSSMAGFYAAASRKKGLKRDFREETV